MIADLRPGDTKVTFQGYAVGQVASVKLSDDLKAMRATLQLDADMRGHLGKGTQFWIIGRSMSLSHLTDIKALISGVSVGIKPAPGKAQDSYEALAQNPVLEYGAQGTALTLSADKLGSIQASTPVYYLGEQVGKVVRTSMTDAHGFSIRVFVKAPFDRLVHDGSRFWRAGPIHLSTGGNGPSLQFQSLPALFQGAIAFETPSDAAAGAVAGPGHDFRLYGSEAAARNAPDAEGVAYRAVFQAASGVPGVDAPVTLMGKRVGSVSASDLQYDPADGKLDVAATIVIEPRNLTLAGGGKWQNPRAQMDDMMRHLIAQGLHAELSNSPPVIGGEQVALRILAGTPGTLGGGLVPEIPSTAGGGVSGIIAQANAVAAKIEALPLTQIADNLKVISAHLATLASSPALTDTLHQVDRSTANIQRISRAMRSEVPPALAALRRTVNEAQRSLASAQDLLSAEGNDANTPDSAALPQTLYEITRTARSLRELANLLDRNPTALLTGRQASR